MHNKNYILTNQRLINEAIANFKQSFNVGKEASSFLYNSKHLQIQLKCGKALEKTGLALRVYMQGLDFLSKEFSETNLREKHLAQQIRMDLIRFMATIIANVLETIKTDHADEPTLKTLLGHQAQIEQGIKEHIDVDFALPKPINLAKIREEYEHSYEHYGRGFIGFFKLPVKRYFKQQSRNEELVFLERIESHCQNYSTLSDELKNSMRLTAAMMVLQSISTETFGEGSQLAKILQSRITHAEKIGQTTQIMNNFIEECRKRVIDIPEHIKMHYEEHTEFNLKKAVVS